MDAGRICKMYILAKPIIHGVQRSLEDELQNIAKQKMKIFRYSENILLCCCDERLVHDL